MNRFLSLLDDMMAFTAWPMEKPKAYGPFHLIFFFVGLAVSIIFAWRLRKLDDKGHRRLLMGVGLFLLITELYKQLFYFCYIGQNTYQWWIFPFQLCSVPMYLCLIAPNLKNRAVAGGMYNFMVYFNLLGGFIAFLEPSGLVHEYLTLTLHAFFWHMMLVFVGLYLAFSHRAGIRMRDFSTAVLTFLALAVLAFIINLAFRKVSNGSINMFFVGPSNSSLIVFKDIAKNCGWYISTLAYLPTVSLGAFLVFGVVRLCNRKKRSLEL